MGGGTGHPGVPQAAGHRRSSQVFPRAWLFPLGLKVSEGPQNDAEASGILGVRWHTC